MASVNILTDMLNSTKAKIRGRLGRWEESDQFVERTLSLAREAQDPVLTTIASNVQAEILLHRGRKDESWDLITRSSRLSHAVLRTCWLAMNGFWPACWPLQVLNRMVVYIVIGLNGF